MVSFPEQSGQLLKQMTALPYVAVEHLHAFDGQRLLLRTFLGAHDEDALGPPGTKADRRASGRLALTLKLFQVLDATRAT